METVPCSSGTGFGDEATIIVHIHMVLVLATDYAGVITATADIVVDCPETDHVVAVVVTIFKIKVATLADPGGAFRDHDWSPVTAEEKKVSPIFVNDS